MATNGAELTNPRYASRAAQLAQANRRTAAPTAYTQTYATADRTVAALTATALTHSAVGGTANGTLVDCTATYSEAAVEENFKELATAFNLLLTDHTDLLQAFTALVDDLQANGVVS